MVRIIFFCFLLFTFFFFERWQGPFPRDPNSLWAVFYANKPKEKASEFLSRSKN